MLRVSTREAAALLNGLGDEAVEEAGDEVDDEGEALVLLFPPVAAEMALPTIVSVGMLKLSDCWHIFEGAPLVLAFMDREEVVSSSDFTTISPPPELFSLTWFIVADFDLVAEDILFWLLLKKLKNSRRMEKGGLLLLLMLLLKLLMKN
jgi:hypothetical protein